MVKSGAIVYVPNRVNEVEEETSPAWMQMLELRMLMRTSTDVPDASIEPEPIYVTEAAC